ncbi:hypothetical protein BDM02DRAFT_3188052 [Thelephora ganbajun]|uniref:Uncharacterized protein n=1 Tax=Thelephora ganbajun TaxID=370292 RepID=A0ACB6ZDQ8_THEGA|nr:hypothetical protein BDM02DRAFT_3188052 [Thelephora ganbajun]
MSTAIAVWSVVVNPGAKETVVPPPDIQIHVKGLSLGAELKDKDSRSSLKLSYEFAASPTDEEQEEEEEHEDGKVASMVTKEVILGSLTPGKIEQAAVDLILDQEDEYVFEVIGKNPIHIIGNYIRDSNLPWSDGEDESDNEDAFHLGEVSSDVEIDPAELDGIGSDEDELEDDSARFEEVVEEPKGKKRTADKMDADEKSPHPTKVQKKAAKKQKGENGVAIPKEDSVKETKEEKKKEKKEKEEKKEKKKEGKAAGDVKGLEGGVQIRDVKAGNGPGAQKGQSVKMRYIGKLTDGKVFDSNTKGKPFAFRLGAGEVIKGWDVGIVGMKAGGERELTIPAPMAYGKRKMSDIPPNSTLKFEVKLLSIN